MSASKHDWLTVTGLPDALAYINRVIPKEVTTFRNLLLSN